MTTPSPNPDDVTTRLRDLCSPLAEILADKARIDAFVKYGSQAADLIDLLRRQLIDEREAERERCANVCLARSAEHQKARKHYDAEGDQNSCLSDAIEALNCAAAIRKGEA